jgi:hypothetical protein
MTRVRKRVPERLLANDAPDGSRNANKRWQINAGKQGQASRSRQTKGRREPAFVRSGIAVADQ